MDSAKSSVWLAQALGSPDQLRQRVAWALSQVLVAAAPGTSMELYSEAWMNYYDIFVRHAFGSFRGVLREVTYSPVMGVYLDSLKNKAFDVAQSLPNENYAREIMQLFSIGIWMLNPDGTRVPGSNGMGVSTYSNEHIVDFSRVFTGFDAQPARSNIEGSPNGDNTNYIDPMTIRSAWHDVYPKVDLHGGHIGDQYPLCDDMPADAHLMKGATYTFRQPEIVEACQKWGFTGWHEGTYDVTLRPSDSPSGSAWTWAQCAAQCALSSACEFWTLQLGGSRNCLLMSNIGTYHATGGHYSGVKMAGCAEVSFSLVADGHQGDPGCSQSPAEGSWRESVQLCFARCESIGAAYFQYHDSTWCGCFAACDFSRPTSDYKSLAFVYAVSSSSQALPTMESSPPPVVLSEGSALYAAFCQGDGGACKLAGSVVLDSDVACQGAECTEGAPSAVTLRGAVYDFVRPPCVNLYFDDGADIEIDPDGKVRGQVGGQTKFKVFWEGGERPHGCPSSCASSGSSCVCRAAVTTSPVFEAVPGAEELQTRLKVGAFTAPGPCVIGCMGGEVKVYSAGLGLDVSTVFEHRGRLYRNVEHRVTVGGYTFRNPPNFMPKGGSLKSSAKAAADEIEAVIDQLFRHQNTPAFIGRHLIQRLVTSNPSPGYVQAVGEAFKLGAYAGKTYSGQYGDLAAAVAAVLLHPEARAGSAGKLREPLLKIVHFMRSMEFADLPGRMVIMKDLSKVMGEFPYQQPTVFNFYLPQYAPDGFPDGMVAPEFQIFDAPLVVSFTEAMISMIKNQGLSDCDGGYGIPSWNCKGSFRLLKSFGTMEELWSQMDLLLTGGRLGPMKEDIMSFAGTEEWVTLYAKGNDGWAISDEATFNRKFWDAKSGILKRECSGCAASHRVIYIKVREPSSWNAYQELLKTWTAHNFQGDFNLYSSLADAKAGTNSWTSCNGNLVGVGFPRDCGPTAFQGGQWNSFTKGGQNSYRFSALVGPPPRPQAGPVLVASGKRCNSNAWLGMYNPDPRPCMEMILARYDCSHEYFNHAGGGDGNCGCVTTLDARCAEAGAQSSGGTVRIYMVQADAMNASMTAEPEPEPEPEPVSLSQIQSAQYAVVLSPHFHTLGEVLPEGPRSPLGDHGSATSSSAGYKAMVVLYLFGGVDSFNMLVPLECALYDQYVSIRKTVALQPSQLLEINSNGQACATFGVHSQLTIVKELYDDGDAAFVTNVGNLNEPRLGHPSARTCPGGFSHNDMQHASQTLYCQMGMNFKNGGGGRMADALAASRIRYNVNSFSLSGQAAWSEGQVTKRSVISGTQTEGGFHPDPRVQRIINNFTTVEFSSIYAKEYINAFGESVNSFLTEFKRRSRVEIACCRSPLTIMGEWRS